jgi:anti-sigma factor RsiW
MEEDLAMAKRIAANLTHLIAMMKRVREIVVDYSADAASEEPVKRERRRKNRPKRPKGFLQGRVVECLKDWMTTRELATAIDADYIRAHRYVKDLCGTGKAERRKRIRDGERITFEYRLCQEGGLFEQASEDIVPVSGDQRDGIADRDSESVPAAGDGVPSGS